MHKLHRRIFAPCFRTSILAIFIATAGCGAVTAAQVLGGIDGVLNASCAALTFLPDEIAVCAGIKGAEGVADALAAYYATPAAGAKLQTAFAAHRARMMAGGSRAPLARIHGLPAFAPQPIADVFNEPAENAACVAFVAKRLEQSAATKSDSGATSGDAGSL